MRKAWEDMKTLRIWTSQKHIHPTKTMETNTNNYISAWDTARNTCVVIQTTSNHAKHVCGLWGCWLGWVSRFSHKARTQTSTTLIEPWQSWSDWEIWARERQETSVSQWQNGELIQLLLSFKQNAIGHYKIVVFHCVNVKCAMVKTWWMSYGHPSHIGNPESVSWILFDWWVKPLLGESPMFFDDGKNDVKWAGGQTCKKTFVWTTKTSWLKPVPKYVR